MGELGRGPVAGRLRVWHIQEGLETRLVALCVKGFGPLRLLRAELRGEVATHDNDPIL